MARVKRTYSLEEETVERIERLAQVQRRDLSTIVDMAVEVYAQQQDSERLSAAEEKLKAVPSVEQV